MMEARLYLLQRISAGVMAPLVIIHLITIMVAVRGGLSAAEILARTQGAGGWFFFYLIFVLAVAVHAPLGLRKIIREWTSLSQAKANAIAGVMFLLILGMGLRAVQAVTGVAMIGVGA